MAKNRMADLNNHLFAQLERLGDEALEGEDLAREIKRSAAMAAVAREIISNGNLVLKAHVVATSNQHGDLPPMLNA